MLEILGGIVVIYLGLVVLGGLISLIVDGL